MFFVLKTPSFNIKTGEPLEPGKQAASIIISLSSEIIEFWMRGGYSFS